MAFRVSAYIQPSSRVSHEAAQAVRDPHEDQLQNVIGILLARYRRAMNARRSCENSRQIASSVAGVASVVRHRAKLVHLCTSLRCQVHAVLAGQGITVPVSDLFGVRGSKSCCGKSNCRRRAGTGWTRYCS